MKTMVRELHVFAHKMCAFARRSSMQINVHFPLDSPSVNLLKSGRAEVSFSSECVSVIIDKIQFQLTSRFDNVVQYGKRAQFAHSHNWNFVRNTYH